VINGEAAAHTSPTYGAIISRTVDTTLFTIFNDFWKTARVRGSL